MLIAKYWFVAVILILALAGLLIANNVLSLKAPQNAPYELTGYYNVQLIPLYSYYENYKATIDCLIKFESSGNPEARGDNNTSFGILQFKKSTFERICVSRYNYRNDIWDSEIQKNCAAELLKEDFNNIFHWSVAHKCL